MTSNAQINQYTLNQDVDHVDYAHDFSVSKNDSFVAYAGKFTNNVLIRDFVTQQIITNIQFESTVASVHFTDKYLLVNLSDDKSTKVLNIDTWDEVISFDDLEGEPIEIESGSGTAYVLLEGNNGMYKIDLSSLEINYIENIAYGYWPSFPDLNSSNIFEKLKNPVAVTSDGNYVVTSDFDHGISVYNNTTNKTQNFTEHPFVGASFLAISPDNKSFAFITITQSGSDLVVCDIETGEIVMNQQYISDVYPAPNNASPKIFFNDESNKLILPWGGNEIGVVDLQTYEIYSYFSDAKPSRISGVQLKDNRLIYFTDRAQLVVFDTEDPVNPSITSFKGDPLLKLELPSDDNKIFAIDIFKEQELYIDLADKTFTQSKIQELDCDGGVRTQLTDDGQKLVSLFNDSQNIHVAEYNNGLIGEAYVIPLNDEHNWEASFLDFRLSRDGNYAYVSSYSSSGFYIVDIKNKNSVKIETEGACGGLDLTSDNQYLYLKVGENIVQYQVNGLAAEKTKVYDDCNVKESIVLSKDGSYLYFIDYFRKALTCIDVADGSKTSFETYFNRQDFVFNEEQNKVLIVNPVGVSGYILNVNGNQFTLQTSIVDYDIEIIVTHFDLNYDVLENKFLINYGPVVQVDPNSGVIESIVEMTPNTVFYKKYDDFYFQTYGDLNALGIPTNWTTNYVDDSGVEESSIMQALFTDYVVDPSSNNPIFLAAAPDSFFSFSEGIPLPVEDDLTEIGIDYQLFPNPCTGTAEIRGPQNQGDLRITVINLLGRVVFEQDTRNAGYTLNLNHLPKGMYCVSITSGESQVVKKLLIN